MNVLSFKEVNTFSMIASNKQERLFDDSENYLKHKNQKILVSSVFYGANASGKSNFIKALSFFYQTIITGNKNLDTLPFLAPVFVLDKKYYKKPSVFEIEVFWKEITYRYGFNLTPNGIDEEWLYVKKAKETEVFHRKGQTFEIPNGNKILGELVSKKMIHSKAFLVTIGAQFNEPSCAGFLEWVSQLKVISGTQDQLYREYTVQRMKNSKDFSKKVLDLLKYADFGIEDLGITSRPGQNFKFTNTSLQIESGNFDDLISKRYVKNEKGKFELKEFIFGDFESEGTQKFAHIAGPIIDVLENGSVLVIDELDVKLHPELAERLILMFQNRKLNPYHAQLIFTTHNTNLLNAKLFRRDQINFIEKDSFGASNLYSLANFKPNGKAPRNDEKFGDNYLKGKYGAIPYLNEFDNLLNR